jgi:hypothetical protein
MTRATDVIVTGFTKNAELSRRAFAPLLELRQQSLIRNIHYVTWDSEALDEFVAPVSEMDIAITRVPQPGANGNANQRGIVYQTRNLEAALEQIADPGTLVVKLRPDFIFRTEFLKSKLRDFDTLCAPAAKKDAWGVAMPRSPFTHKIWIPWADANQPFFYEDAAYIGLKRDLAKLVTPDIENRTEVLADMNCGSLAHVLRYVDAFLPRFPIFKRYVENYGGFANDIEYRKNLVPLLLQDGFFWHLIVAHSWVLHTSFHIDCGEPGDLRFFPNTLNFDWSDAENLRLTPPYDNIGQWRDGAKAGTTALPALMRHYGRLVDDAWPRAFFTQKMTDMPGDVLARLALSVTLYSSGGIRDIERNFYTKLATFHREHWRTKQAA